MVDRTASLYDGSDYDENSWPVEYDDELKDE